jgi:transcriptional regulator with XRE-family HTH domain
MSQKSFGERLKALGLGNAEFARIVSRLAEKKISPSQVSQWATGHRKPSAGMLAFLSLYEDYAALQKEYTALEKEYDGFMETIIKDYPDTLKKPAKEQKEEKMPQDSIQRPLMSLNETAVRRLIEISQERGYLTFAELNLVLPPDRLSSEQVEDSISALQEMGISLKEGDEIDARLESLLEQHPESEQEDKKKTA